MPPSQKQQSHLYLHYQDIYDLSEQIGKEVLTNILNSISRPENVLEKPDVFTREITTGFFSQINLIQLLFSGSQAHILPDLVDSSIREYIYRLKPEYTDNMQFNILSLHAHQGKLLCVL